MNLPVIIAEVVLGAISYHDLPEFATKCLEEGYDTPTLRVLAGLLSESP